MAALGRVLARIDPHHGGVVHSVPHKDISLGEAVRQGGLDAVMAGADLDLPSSSRRRSRKVGR